MDKVLDYFDTFTLIAIATVLIIAEIGWIMMNVTDLVPEGHVGFYMKRRTAPNESTPMLTPGSSVWRRPFYRLLTYPVVVVPEGCAALVFAHIGSKAMYNPATYVPDMQYFSDPQRFVALGGRQGFQEVVLPPGSYAIHPYAFSVAVIDGGELIEYGALAPWTDALIMGNPYIHTDSEGHLVLNIEPSTADEDSEDLRDHLWTATRNGVLTDASDIGFTTDDGGYSMVVNVMFPKGDTAGVQKFVDTTLCRLFDEACSRTNPADFAHAMHNGHRLIHEMNTPYRATIVRGTFRLVQAS